MATTIGLNDILDVVIPGIVIIWLIYILYKPFKEPLNALWDKIRGWRESREESDVQESIVKTITYE